MQDSSVRLWDLAGSGEPELLPMRLQGHVNASKNLVRAVFGPGNLVFGGSEEGAVAVWTRNSGRLVSRLMHSSMSPNPETVYDVRYA